MNLLLERLPTEIGEILIVTDEGDRLRALDFAEYETRMMRLLVRHYGEVKLEARPSPSPAARAIGKYLKGELHALDGLEVATGGTAFQRQVWAALRSIPAGETLSYSGLAQRIGRPKAVRAVGLANGSNPIAVVVPCHRVIGASGALTGYAGGMERKAWLLRHEGAVG
ncbi:MAG TPA: methylated-DNA--[protein]-cysteine S-methyltransferase [Caulobacteraceae bacterium]|nr:methylated-DNA--[protein]-cysteine S-methyltransferase [Caulobacteraceae bacterium]